MTPNFDLALQQHFDAITNRDIDAFAAHMTRNEKLYTIVQNGHAFKTPAEIIAIHADWFKDPRWIWQGSVVHKAVGQDMAMAVIKYSYRPSATAPAVESWLTYVFALEDGAWKIIHDQNTALNYAAFSASLSQSEQ